MYQHSRFIQWTFHTFHDQENNPDTKTLNTTTMSSLQTLFAYYGRKLWNLNYGSALPVYSGVLNAMRQSPAAQQTADVGKQGIAVIQPTKKKSHFN